MKPADRHIGHRMLLPHTPIERRWRLREGLPGIRKVDSSGRVLDVLLGTRQTASRRRGGTLVDRSSAWHGRRLAERVRKGRQRLLIHVGQVREGV